MRVKRITVFTEQPSLAEQVFCNRTENDLTEKCQEVIGTVERLAAVASEETYDEIEARDLRQKLHRLGVTNEQLHRFFSARFVVGISVNPDQTLTPEIATLQRVGVPQSRIEELVTSGKQVAEFCKQHGVAADHVIITKLTTGQTPTSLVLPL